MSFVMKRFQLLIVAVLFCAKVSAQASGSHWRVRLPLAHTQAFDFHIARAGVEFAGLNDVRQVALELGVPYRSYPEHQASKGFFGACQVTFRPNPEGRLNWRMGLRLAYTKARLNDYIEYPASQGTFNYYEYRMAEFSKSRLRAGVVLVVRTKLWQNLGMEFQMDMGYGRYKVNPPAGASQSDYHNYDFFGFSHFKEVPTANLGVNLYYILR